MKESQIVFLSVYYKTLPNAECNDILYSFENDAMPLYFFIIFSLRSIRKCEKKEESSKGICPLLQFVCKSGNATVYQWRTGNPPKEIRKENSINDTDMKSTDIQEVGFVLKILQLKTLTIFPEVSNAF